MAIRCTRIARSTGKQCRRKAVRGTSWCGWCQGHAIPAAALPEVPSLGGFYVDSFTHPEEHAVLEALEAHGCTYDDLEQARLENRDITAIAAWLTSRSCTGPSDIKERIAQFGDFLNSEDPDHQHGTFVEAVRQIGVRGWSFQPYEPEPGKPTKPSDPEHRFVIPLGLADYYNFKDDDTEEILYDEHAKKALSQEWHKDITECSNTGRLLETLTSPSVRRMVLAEQGPYLESAFAEAVLTQDRWGDIKYEYEILKHSRTQNGRYISGHSQWTGLENLSSDEEDMKTWTSQILLDWALNDLQENHANRYGNVR